jgi:hypothetical protein
MNPRPIHRVVTGHDADGKAIVASQGPLPTKSGALQGCRCLSTTAQTPRSAR